MQLDAIKAETQRSIERFHSHILLFIGWTEGKTQFSLKARIIGESHTKIPNQLATFASLNPQAKGLLGCGQADGPIRLQPTKNVLFIAFRQTFHQVLPVPWSEPSKNQLFSRYGKRQRLALSVVIARYDDIAHA